jgi:type IV pilus assembly protein PilP
VAFLSFGGCGGEIPQKQKEPVLPKTSAAEAKPLPLANPAEAEKAVEAPQAPSFQYNPEGRRDPFQSVIVAGSRKKLGEAIPPLQRVELAELRLTGIVWGAFGYNALLRTPDGKGYSVRVGSRVGSNQGVVREISKSSMTIEERFTDIFGEKKVREVTMDLHPRRETLE